MHFCAHLGQVVLNVLTGAHDGEAKYGLPACEAAAYFRQNVEQAAENVSLGPASGVHFVGRS